MKQINLNKLPPKEKKETKNEIQVLSQLRHPCIVSYRESFIERGILCIMMDYADSGDLEQFVKRQGGRYMSEDQILDFFVQICLALKHLHDKKILHRDIKGQNIFLHHKTLVKLGDFGISKVLSATCEMAKTCIGTPYYMSPELAANRPYNAKSDIWAVGCVLYEMVCLRHAFDANNMKGLMMRIQRESYRPIPSQYSNDLRNLIAVMLAKDPSKRPSVNQILRLPFIQQRISKYLDSQLQSEEFSHTILHGAMARAGAHIGPDLDDSFAIPNPQSALPALGVKLPPSNYGNSKTPQPISRIPSAGTRESSNANTPVSSRRPTSAGLRPPSISDRNSPSPVPGIPRQNSNFNPHQAPSSSPSVRGNNTPVQRVGHPLGAPSSFLANQECVGPSGRRYRNREEMERGEAAIKAREEAANAAHRKEQEEKLRQLAQRRRQEEERIRAQTEEQKRREEERRHLEEERRKQDEARRERRRKEEEEEMARIREQEHERRRLIEEKMKKEKAARLAKEKELAEQRRIANEKRRKKEEEERQRREAASFEEEQARLEAAERARELRRKRDLERLERLKQEEEERKVEKLQLDELERIRQLEIDKRKQERLAKKQQGVLQSHEKENEKQKLARERRMKMEEEEKLKREAKQAAFEADRRQREEEKKRLEEEKRAKEEERKKNEEERRQAILEKKREERRKQEEERNRNDDTQTTTDSKKRDPEPKRKVLRRPGTAQSDISRRSNEKAVKAEVTQSPPRFQRYSDKPPTIPSRQKQPSPPPTPPFRIEGDKIKVKNLDSPASNRLRPPSGRPQLSDRGEKSDRRSSVGERESEKGRGWETDRARPSTSASSRPSTSASSRRETSKSVEEEKAERKRIEALAASVRDLPKVPISSPTVERKNQRSIPPLKVSGVAVDPSPPRRSLIPPPSPSKRRTPPPEKDENMGRIDSKGTDVKKEEGDSWMSKKLRPSSAQFGGKEGSPTKSNEVLAIPCVEPDSSLPAQSLFIAHQNSLPRPPQRPSNSPPTQHAFVLPPSRFGPSPTTPSTRSPPLSLPAEAPVSFPATPGVFSPSSTPRQNRKSLERTPHTKSVEVLYSGDEFEPAFGANRNDPIHKFEIAGTPSQSPVVPKPLELTFPAELGTTIGENGEQFYPSDFESGSDEDGDEAESVVVYLCEPDTDSDEDDGGAGEMMDLLEALEKELKNAKTPQHRRMKTKKEDESEDSEEDEDSSVELTFNATIAEEGSDDDWGEEDEVVEVRATKRNVLGNEKGQEKRKEWEGRNGEGENRRKESVDESKDGKERRKWGQRDEKKDGRSGRRKEVSRDDCLDFLEEDDLTILEEWAGFSDEMDLTRANIVNQLNMYEEDLTNSNWQTLIDYLRVVVNSD
ncbi:putative G2-specific protein kinase nimA [Blattamonas nauphoetae]|uniref:non-specific serine/threonine protein kinase n=1 Tax=Blattamonas nauphoetae TaxID=2049346 RepID=A0ABQ9YIT5_9EUKA|nr:putative G2-specific protein kinase nimA [Blattamonas nauphoetae]